MSVLDVDRKVAKYRLVHVQQSEKFYSKMRTSSSGNCRPQRMNLSQCRDLLQSELVVTCAESWQLTLYISVSFFFKLIIP